MQYEIYIHILRKDMKDCYMTMNVKRLTSRPRSAFVLEEKRQYGRFR